MRRRLAELGGDQPCRQLPQTACDAEKESGSIALSDLTATLTFFMEQPVVDRTGIGGDFDIQLPPWSRGTQVTAQAADDGQEPAPDLSSPSITVIQEQLGLKLESSKSRFDILVIDQVEKPTED